MNIREFLVRKVVPRELIEIIKKVDYNLHLFKINKKRGITPRKTVLCFPNFPYKKEKIYTGLMELGYKITNNINDHFDWAIHYENNTFKKKYDELFEIGKRKKVINLNCYDISKERVEKHFQEVFGYSSRINPLTHKGVCLRKTNLNGHHDGKIIECPTAQVEEGFIYQKYVTNFVDENHCVEYRLSVLNKKVNYCLKRLRHIKDRFNGENEKPEIISPFEVLSQDEFNKILLFLDKMGLDYAEVDIIRDSGDGRIYLLDANDTPYFNTRRGIPQDHNEKLKACLLNNLKEL